MVERRTTSHHNYFFLMHSRLSFFRLINPNVEKSHDDYLTTNYCSVTDPFWHSFLFILKSGILFFFQKFGSLVSFYWNHELNRHISYSLSLSDPIWEFWLSCQQTCTVLPIKSHCYILRGRDRRDFWFVIFCERKISDSPRSIFSIFLLFWFHTHFLHMPTSSFPTVVDILVFPIKSCHYVRLQECEVDSLGIKHDRRFMIVYADTNRFVTQR